jgi:hypothetical protein
MLTGTAPFDSPERSELMIRTAQVEETAPPMTASIAQAPAVLDVLMARALAKDPMHRYASAFEMGDAFQSALGLEQTPGWEAQQRLADKAQGISKQGIVQVGEAPEISEGEAERLRTAVMTAYAG